MQQVIFWSALLALGMSHTGQAAAPKPSRPVHTYSIVARDPATGQLGVAVQSHWYSVGTIVSWAEAGVGAVATQSFAEISYGPLGLELMRAGKTAQEALTALLAIDPTPDVRQVAMVDAQGRVATHTGKKCIAEAGDIIGDQFSCQANLMQHNTVWQAMHDAYQSAGGDLAERLLIALEAAEKEGGDIRGRQSAAILIVSGNPTGVPWKDRVIDLRVEDHAAPLVELRRLVTLHRAYEHMNRGDELMAENNVAAALTEYAAAQQLAPDNLEMTYWTAVTLIGAGKIDDALPLFRRVFRADERWRTLTPRLPASGLLPDDPDMMRQILEMGADER